MDLQQLVPDYIRHFQAYVPSKPDGELKALYGCRVLHRLNNNENSLGPPRAARDIIRRFTSIKSAQYPSGDSYYLRCALADHLGKHPEQFLVGNGSCEVIGAVVKALCEKGDNIITADKTFAVYEWAAESSGLQPRLVPLKDYAYDPTALLQHIDPRTKVIFLCNPNNPTGTYWNREVVTRFLTEVGGRCVVVLDEAYFEYVEQPDYPDGMALLEQHPNLVVFRTFSKMYGLAGLRVGYLAGCSELVEVLRRGYIVYSVNTLAQAAAQAALTGAPEHIQETRTMIREGKGLLTRGLDQLGLTYLCGQGSYVMIRVPLADTLLYRRLMRRGLMVRTMTGFRFPNWIRVSVVGPEILQQFLEGLAAELREIHTNN